MLVLSTDSLGQAHEDAGIVLCGGVDGGSRCAVFLHGHSNYLARTETRYTNDTVLRTHCYSTYIL